MKNNRFYLVFITLLLIYSCKNDKSSFSEEVIMQGEFNNAQDLLKVGKWYYFTSNQDTLKYGNYRNGLKNGVWKYFYNDTIYNIEWDVYVSDFLKINYPSKWQVKKIENFLFYTSKDTLTGFNIIRKTSPFSMENYLKKYLKDLKKATENKINNLNFKKEILQDSMVLYKGSFSYFDSDNTEIFCITSLFKYKNSIYDCTYFKKGATNIIDEAIQGDIVTSIFIKNEEIFKIPAILYTKSLKFDSENNWIK